MDLGGTEMKTLNEVGVMTVRDLIDMLSEYDDKAYVTIGTLLHPIGVREKNGYVNIRVKYSDQLKKEEQA